MKAFPTYTKDEQEIMKEADEIRSRGKTRCQEIEKDFNQDGCCDSRPISLREQFMEELRERVRRQKRELKEAQDFEIHMQSVFFPDEAYGDVLRMYAMRLFVPAR